MSTNEDRPFLARELSQGLGGDDFAMHAEEIVAPDALEQAEHYLYLGDFRNALRFYSKFTDRNRDAWAAWIMVIRMELLRNDLKSAANWIQRARHLYPGMAPFEGLRYLHAQLAGEPDKAEGIRADVLKKHGEDPHVRLIEAEYRMLRGGGGLRRHFTGALEAFPEGDAHTPRVMGVVLAHRQRWTLAAACLEISARRAPEHRGTWLLLVKCFDELGRQSDKFEALDHLYRLCGEGDVYLERAVQMDSMAIAKRMKNWVLRR